MADTMADVLNPGTAWSAPPEFPHAPRGWTPEFATAQATKEGLSLGEDHWEVVRALQEFFERHQGDRIVVRELRDALDERFHSRGAARHLYQLFPEGPIAQGCRIAGLEPPSGSVDPSFGSVR